MKGAKKKTLDRLPSVFENWRFNHPIVAVFMVVGIVLKYCCGGWE